jgi:uncharacterized protein (TIGR02147 family)
MSEVSDFKDYRDFIKFRFEDLKKSDPNLSYQKVANRIGSTKSYLKLVIDKKRHMSLDKLLPLAKYFRLSTFETQFVIFLLLVATSKDPEVKEFFKSILASYQCFSRSKQTEFNLNKISDTKFASHEWIQMAILELSSRPDFSAKAEWIHKKLGGNPILSLNQAQEAMDLLIAKRLLLKQNDGMKSRKRDYLWDASPFDLDDFQRMFLSGLKRAEIAILQKGKSSLHRPNRHHSYCLTLSHEEVDKVMKLSEEFRDKFLEIAKNSKSHDRAIFVQCHAFAISVDEDLKKS